MRVLRGCEQGLLLGCASRGFVEARGPLFCALPFVIGIPYLLWVFWERPNTGALWLLGVPLFLASVLGILVGFRGCNACVARLCGEL